jgi:hypothetical protein
MITVEELKILCTDRLEDAKCLFKEGRLDGAFYLVGYAIELGLKRKICLQLKWSGYPNTRKEFENLTSFKTHNLDVLLHLSGVETEIKTNFFSEWSVVTSWNTEARYSSEKKSVELVEGMLAALEIILENL